VHSNLIAKPSDEQEESPVKSGEAASASFALPLALTERRARSGEARLADLVILMSGGEGMRPINSLQQTESQQLSSSISTLSLRLESA
jgi:hypothetical protein